MSKRIRRGVTHGDPIKDATVAALNRILEPLIELMLDAGVTVHEFNQLVRERAVRVAMKRLTKQGSKESKSRAAIMTGLPRSEVARILRSSESTSTSKSDQLPARRILAAWNDDPRFSAPNGQPAILPIFGRAVSFEQLVDRHGGGIPVRAMLDELTQMQAIERLPDQKVKVRVRVQTFVGHTLSSIDQLGERCHELLQTLCHNRQEKSGQLFQETALSDNIDLDTISVVRRELSQQATKFIEKAEALLTRSEQNKSLTVVKAAASCRLGVTIYFFQDLERAEIKNAATKSIPRKNLQRQSRSMGKDAIL